MIDLAYPTKQLEVFIVGLKRRMRCLEARLTYGQTPGQTRPARPRWHYVTRDKARSARGTGRLKWTRKPQMGYGIVWCQPKPAKEAGIWACVTRAWCIERFGHDLRRGGIKPLNLKGLRHADRAFP